MKRSDRYKKASERRQQNLVIVLAILNILDKLVSVIQKLTQ